MLPNDNVSMSVGHLDHVLIVYNSLMEHVTCVAKFVGSCVPIRAHRCLPDPKCLFHPSGLSLCLSVDHFCLVPVDDIWFSSTAWSVMADLSVIHCSPLPWRLGSVYQLWKSSRVLQYSPYQLSFCRFKFIEKIGDCAKGEVGGPPGSSLPGSADRPTMILKLCLVDGKLDYLAPPEGGSSVVFGRVCFVSQI